MPLYHFFFEALEGNKKELEPTFCQIRNEDDGANTNYLEDLKCFCK